MSKSNHKFQVPCTVWRLLPGFKPVQTTLVEARSTVSTYYVDDKGKYHSENTLFPTKAQAIKDGWDRLVAEQARLDKMQVTLTKRSNALRLAEREGEG